MRWIKWGIGLIVVIMAGSFVVIGAINAYFSSDRIRELAQEELKKSQPNWEVDFSDAGIALRGTFLRPTLQFHDLKVSGQSNCHNWRGQAIETQIRFAWRLLLVGILQIRPVIVKGLEISAEQVAGCENPSETSSAQFEKGVSRRSAGRSSTEKTESKRDSNRTTVPEPIFSGLSIDVVKVFYNERQIQFTEVKTGPFRLDQPFQVNTRVEQKKGVKTVGPVLDLNVEVEKNDVKFVGRGKWREGDLRLKGRWENSEWSLEGDLEHIPLSSVTDFFSFLGVWENPFPHQSVWFSCQFNGAGTSQKNRVRVELNKCGVEGELGEIKSSPLRFAIGLGEKPDLDFDVAVKLGLKGVHIEKVFGVLGINMLGGVLEDFGRLDAEVNIDTEGRIELEGEAKDLLLVFSNAGVRALQRMPSIRGKLYYDGQRVSGQLLDTKLKQGSFIGGLSFNFTPDFGEGVLQANIESLSFAPKIQELLMGGEMSSLALFGKVIVEDNVLKKWTGNFGLDSIQSQKISARGVRVESNFSGGLHHFKVLSKEGELDVDSAFYRWIKPVFLTQSLNKEKITWEKFSTELEVLNKTHLDWKKAEIRIRNAQTRLASHGKLRPAKDPSNPSTSKTVIDGNIRVVSPNYKTLTWDVTGTLPEPQLVPNYQSLKALAVQPQEKASKKREQKKK